MPTVLPTTKHPTKLFNCHCFDLFKRIPDQSIDLVLTDPPYGTTACKWDSVIPLEPMWEQLKRVIKSNGAIVMTASQPFTITLIASNMKMFRYCWVWEKNFATNFFHAKRQPLRKHEDIAVFYKNTGSYFPIKTEGHKPTQSAKGSSSGKLWHGENTRDYEGGDTSRYPTSIIKFDAVDPKSRVHPTQKPVALMEYMIKTYTNMGETVLDFAMGSGTTGVACKSLNRLFIGCDIDIENGYFEIARDRIKYAPPSNLPNNPQ